MLHDEETGAEGSGDNISCGPTVCQVLYAHFTHKCPERDGIDFFFLAGGGAVSFYREENVNSEKFDNLSKARQLVRETDER